MKQTIVRKSSIFKSYSQNSYVDLLIGDFFRIEDKDNCQLWIERANPADVLSREDSNEVLGCKVRLRLDVMEVWVKSTQSAGGDSAAKGPNSQKKRSAADLLRKLCASFCQREHDVTHA